MPITDIVPHKDGGAWGWDDSANKWVPVDPQMLAGNPIANLARGAGLGFQNVNQGARELLMQSDPTIPQQGQVLKLQTQAAQNAAPWTTALGMGAPEMLAGGAAALATGGTSIPLMLAGQAAAGGGVGFMKPGDMAERVQNAALGAVFAAGGAGLGEAAQKGIMAGLALGRSVTEGSVEATAQGVINGVARQQNAEARAAMAASADEAGGAAGVSGAAPDQAGSVGAAATPAGQLDPEVALQSQLLDQADAQASERMTKGTAEQLVENGRRVGIEPAWWSGTPKGSNASMMGAFSEFAPNRPAQEVARVGKNAEQLNRLGARAMGAASSLDPVKNTYTSLDAGAMAHIRAQLDQGWEALQGEMPNIGNRDFIKAIEAVDRPREIGTAGQAFIKWQDKVKQDMIALGSHEQQHLTGEEFINQTKSISHMLSQPTTDDTSMQKFIEVQNRLYNLAEKATKADVGKGPHGGDQTITGKGWSELRKEEQAYMMMMRAGAVDQQGNVNPVALKRILSQQKKNGGFGVRREEMTEAQRDLYDGVVAAAYDKSAVPPTGARLAGHLGHLARGMYSSQIAKTGGAGALGAGAYNTIWGR